ncbi:MAG: 16S rRNA (cytosine(1402)-N(4))-methyltransferase RsmH [bacterium]|nr:16S rRNA (cytosine(1402)-N(4))-methyltransferase RsmH [bacterium]
MESYHTPVLLNEVIEYLKPKSGGRYIDATMNGGGHTLAIAEQVQPDGIVLGIEWDSELFKQFKLKEESLKFKDSIIPVNDSYTNMAVIAKDHDFQPDGILFDLGLSSWHYEMSGRGFTFKKDEPLDMRFNTSGGVPVSEIVNLYDVPELEQIIRDYGEEQFARSISESIGLNRKKRPIMTTEDLVAVINVAVPDWYKHRKIHFATKTFQALRVVANDELGNVVKGVRTAIDILKPGGRIVVISFQGHEDKIVREIFKEQVKAGRIVQPVKGTIRPTWPEQQANPRSRSAKMKVAERI